ncbi:phosphoribosyltransferase family protein [Streptomyces boncukensis]|uniref:Phosphoribosyltransferase n=1 Tax=Streptomyces boncukensis TaxID=2711219 RepID=A0A6G4X3D4_9ACTN|nr:alpha/beta family hydrolase [Streptomyces boncukensis]NGO72056.1 phosphoribosyltransferase [Streptomyces boncukensis]
MRFDDRPAAGRVLAAELERLRAEDAEDAENAENAEYAEDWVVLGLPRGGVPVAFEVAGALDAPLDVTVVRKLGVPSQPELGFGAVGEGGARLVNDSVVSLARLSDAQCAQVEEEQRAELERRVRRYRGSHPRIPVAGRTAVLVDDGLATGATAAAACQVVRAQGAARVVLAVPVGPPDAVAWLRTVADEVVCPNVPRSFAAVGAYYRDFSQTDDSEVAELLARARHPQPGQAPRHTGDGRHTDVRIDAGEVRLAGDLAVPEGALAVVAFAHGSGSGRHSPRNRYVAAALNRVGLATLLFDLLTEEEDGDRAAVFDVELLGTRLAATTEWLRGEVGLPLGYFGASTGAAAALTAAARPAADPVAVVSRGGRPDLAPAAALGAVAAPTLLIVGGRDTSVLDLNRRAAARMRCEHRVHVVPGAGHLFEEPGCLDAVAELAGDWFVHHAGLAAPR